MQYRSTLHGHYTTGVMVTFPLVRPWMYMYRMCSYLLMLSAK